MLEMERSPAGARLARPDSPSASGRSSGRYRRAFWLLVALALVVRVVVVLVTPEYRTIHDDRDYDRIARHVAHGHGYPGDRVRLPGHRVVHRPATYRPPGWPYVLGGVYAIFGHDKTAARYVLAVFGTGIVALLGLIALQLFGPRVSLWATGLGAVYVPLILVGSSLISETQFVLLELGALACALAARRSGGWKLAVLAGALAGMAALTRINGALLVVPIVLLLWGRPVRSWRALARPAAAAVAAVLAIAPWTIRNAVEVHAFVPVATESGETLAGTYNSVSDADKINPAAWRLVRDTEHKKVKAQGLDSVTLDKRLRTAAFDYVRAHPAYPLKVAFWNGRRLLDLEGQHRWRFEARTIDVAGPGWADAGVYAFWLTALIAVAGAFSGRARRIVARAPRAVWLAPALLALSALLVIGETPRFRAPVDPFFVLLAACALAALSPGRRQSPAGA